MEMPVPTTPRGDEALDKKGAAVLPNAQAQFAHQILEFKEIINKQAEEMIMFKEKLGDASLGKARNPVVLVALRYAQFVFLRAARSGRQSWSLLRDSVARVGTGSKALHPRGKLTQCRHPRAVLISAAALYAAVNHARASIKSQKRSARKTIDGGFRRCPRRLRRGKPTAAS